MSYKARGMAAFRAHRFDLARTFFSLAHDEEPSEELLFLIELCATAKDERDEAIMLFEFYTLKPKPKPKELFRILNSINEKIAKKNLEISREKESEKESVSAILYKDFMSAVRANGSFKNVFESVIFSSKIAVESKDEMLEFLEILLENGYDEMSLNYIEASAEHFAGDVRFDEILKKIKHEN